MANFKKLFIFLCFLFLINSFISISYAQKDSLNKTKITTQPPTRYYLKKIAWFPLDFPGYVLRAAVFPIDYTFRKMQERRMFNRIADKLSNEDKTIWVYPIIEAGAGSSFGGGLGTKFTNLFNDGYHLDAKYRIHINLDQYVSFDFGKYNAFDLWNRPVSFALELNFKRQLGEDYYGIGNNSKRSNHTEFANNDLQAMFKLGWQFFPHFYFEPQIGFCASHTAAKQHGSHPSIQNVFPMNSLPGFNRWVDYFTPGLKIRHDTRENKDRPRSGGEQYAAYHYYQFLGDGNFSFNHYELHLSQYIPVWHPGVVLAVHNTWVFEQKINGSRIPFDRQADLDAWHMLRGFDRGRFRDSSSVVFNVEYFFPLSGILEGMLFYDTGRVFSGITNFSFGEFKYSAGAGLNLHLFDINLLRFRAAYGGEGVNIIIGVTTKI